MSLKIRVTASGTCPFCGGRFDVGYLESGKPAVLHTVPYCSTYAALEIDEYLAAVNRSNRTRRTERPGKPVLS